MGTQQNQKTVLLLQKFRVHLYLEFCIQFWSPTDEHIDVHMYTLMLQVCHYIDIDDHRAKKERGKR